MRWRAPEGFRYLGRLEFPLEEKAWVDRHFFARVNGGEIERLIVFQFEGFRDGVEGRYRFGIPEGEDLAGSDYRFSPERIRFAGHGWVHNTWVFDQAASAAERLGYESDRTLAFLADQGLAIGDELMMSRFVTEIGPDGRDELILFYLMPLAEVGRTLPDFPGGGPPSDAYDRLSEQLTRESLTAFANETFGPPDG